jgi:pyridoxamine 5'-phosphate oxidase
MINFHNISKDAPYKKFLKYYDLAKTNKQNLIEAISISSFSKKYNEVNSRYVNLKYIRGSEWIFFTNYDSPKSNEFMEHNQICATFHWDAINTQIRIKAKISKTSKDFSDNHYANRSIEKNILAHSSNQSEIISSYKMVKDKYELTKLKKDIIKHRPKNWGGFSFIPYYFEFWEGHENRLNKRECFLIENKKWEKYFLAA